MGMKHSGSKAPEKAILVGVATREVPLKTLNDHLAELGRLAETAGAEICATISQRRPSLDPATLVGAGKVREIAEAVKEHCADIVIFDEDLSGSQLKRLEKDISAKILDRSAVILDIFARHAKTAESKIQVEVAQLQYMLPRLTRAWTHLSRQVGGIGTRGPGETQLEVDRRMVRKRIADLKTKLEKVEDIRSAQYSRRENSFHIALVGYTNAGKSTLMNALTRAGVEAVDKLFATLDSTTRKLYLSPDKPAVISDTVGFIRKLPVDLVASFKSTLGVVTQATLIIHVVDGESSDFEDQMATTARILKELETEEIPRLTVFNKMDAVTPERRDSLKVHYPQGIQVSAANKEGVDVLRRRIEEIYDDALAARRPNPALQA